MTRMPDALRAGSSIEGRMMTKRIRSLSLMRVLASLAVVLLHSFYGAAGITRAGDAAILSALTGRNLMLWAVPLFVMVSGTLLLDPLREISLRRLFRHYVPRVLAALLLVSFLAWGFDAWLLGQLSPLAALKALYTATGWSHLWYLYLLLALYLLLPFYRMIALKADRTEMRYLLILQFLFLSLLPLLNTLTGVKAGFYLCVSTIYPLYFFLGFALYQRSIQIRWIPAALLFLLSTGGLVFLSLRAGVDEFSSLSKLLSNYAFFPVILQAASLYSLLLYWEPGENSFLVRLVDFLDRHSFGIYLFHMFPLKAILVVLGMDPLTKGGIPAVLLLAAVSYLSSLLLTWLLKKLPGLKAIL